MTEREVQQISSEVSQADGWLDGKPLPPWLAKLVIIGGMSSFLVAFAQSEQGEDPGRDHCDSDQLSCVFNENEGGGGEGSWSINPEREGVEFDHVKAGWAVNELECEDTNGVKKKSINGGVIGDRFWQAWHLDYEFPGTEETVEVTDLSGDKTCVVPAEDFWEATQKGLVVFDDEVEAVVVEEVSDEQLQEEIKEEVPLEPEAVVTAEVVKRDNREAWKEIGRTIKDRVLDTFFGPEAVVKGFLAYAGCLVIIVGGIGVYGLRRLLGSDSGGGGRLEPLVTGSDRRRSKDERAALYDFFKPDEEY